jgi:hypothetical protein
MKAGQLKPQNGAKNLLSQKQKMLSQNLLTEHPTTSTSLPTNAITLTHTKRALGLFRDYQLNRYWDNFNFDLYKQICEIKINTL